MTYKAVTREELISRLGRQCSPMAGRDGYVIGPDINGRICHVATCFSLPEARKQAEELNARHGNERPYQQFPGKPYRPYSWVYAVWACLSSNRSVRA